MRNGNFVFDVWNILHMLKLGWLENELATLQIFQNKS